MLLHLRVAHHAAHHVAHHDAHHDVLDVVCGVQQHNDVLHLQLNNQFDLFDVHLNKQRYDTM